MKIAGLIKTSLIDYPGTIAAVIFTQGCNFRCGFCHNPDLVPIENEGTISEQEVLDYLEKKKKVLDGVVITGGEPVVQKDLKDFIGKVKGMGYLVKLDSNGSNPKLLKELIDEKLVDYIAMDIKGQLEKYETICAYLNKKVIQESVSIIINSDISSEFRTTVLPFYHEADDFTKIGKLIKGAKRYTLQGFRPKITLDKSLQSANSFSGKDLDSFKEIIKEYVEEVVIHPNF